MRPHFKHYNVILAAYSGSARSLCRWWYSGSRRPAYGALHVRRRHSSGLLLRSGATIDSPVFHPEIRIQACIAGLAVLL